MYLFTLTFNCYLAYLVNSNWSVFFLLVNTIAARNRFYKTRIIIIGRDVTFCYYLVQHHIDDGQVM